jgi:hypothetical protein
MIYLVYFMLLYGVFEIISNSIHLSRGSVVKIGQSAKRQHQELPLNLSDKHFFIKAIIMFIFGVIFIFAGILFLCGLDSSYTLIFICVLVHGIYGLLQAVIYRYYFNVWGALVVYNIHLIAFFILK